jgi:hypothetical protein
MGELRQRSRVFKAAVPSRIIGRLCPLTHADKLSIRGLLESPDAALCRARNNVSAPVAVEVHLSGLSGEGN